MSDDTTTWLKKNPVNPMKRNLRNSLRFHPSNLDMDNSIMSNPDQVRDKQLCIPPIIQRATMRMQKLKEHNFKVPEIAPTSSRKGQNNSSSKSGSKLKNRSFPSRLPNPRKSVLPIARSNQSGEPERKSMIGSLSRPSMLPGGPRVTGIKQHFIQKLVELDEKNKSKGKKAEIPTRVPGDGSVPRSILKQKQASLRRLSQGVRTRTAKKVLFECFENDSEKKENNQCFLLEESQFTEELSNFPSSDEPTVFLNFPSSKQMESTPTGEFQLKEERLNWSKESNDSLNVNDIADVVKTVKTYQETLKSLQRIGESFDASLRSFCETHLAFQNQVLLYKKDSEGICEELSKLGAQLEANLNKVLLEEEKEDDHPVKRRRSLEKNASGIKIKMSDKSKPIKKSPGRKMIPALKRGLKMN